MVSTEASVTRYNPTESQINGTVLRKDRKEMTSLPQNVNIGQIRTFLKQTTASGAGTIATIKHRERVRRQRDSAPTPQNSNSQWQDWSGWQGVNNSS